MPLQNIIDVHSHAVIDIGQSVAPRAILPSWSLESAIALMDQNGIEVAMLSVPDAANYADGAEACDIARRANEILAGFVQKYPRRFGALATIPGRDIDGAVAEMEYALDTLKMDGVSTATNVDDVYLGDAQFDPWFDEMNRRRVTLFVHPTNTKAGQPIDLGIAPSMLEFMFDSTRMLTNMVVTGAKKRFSKMRIVSSHAGGTIPFLAKRIAVLGEHFGVGKERKPMTSAEIFESFQTFYYDLTGSTTMAQLAGLKELVPTSQMLCGFDIPFMPNSSIPRAIDDICGFSEFTADDLKAMSRKNALSLYPKLASRLGS